MSNATLDIRPATATAPVHVAEATPTVPQAASTRSAVVLPPEPSAAASHAVDAVLTAVDSASTGHQHSVNLQFSVGGADLSVRVELRSDEVHATFRTDSPELRTALAHEWHAASADRADHGTRLADPVFTSNSSDSSASSSFAGNGAPDQRDPGGRSTSAEEFSMGSTTRASSTGTDAAAAVETPVSTPESLPTALHLQAVA